MQESDWDATDRPGTSLDRPIRVLSVDDHQLLREGVNAVISAHADIAIAGEAADGLQAIDAYRLLRPDVMLLDLQMPGLDGLQVLERIRCEFPEARIIVLTTFAGDAQAFRALEQGAAGYVLKDGVRTELVDAIRTVFNGGRHLSVSVAREIAWHLDSERLNERECEVLSLAAAGNSNRQIASHLSLSEDTIKGYMKSIFAKLGVSDRTHAVTVAVRRGMIRI
ncbi:response regulator transcription factor [Sphingomonas sp. OTU376]|uniref:response regulator transcription factor n=1 Tax=Sphingomonas sp. OTU376 TaxID=3043863 RepID=UPI00313B6512